MIANYNIYIFKKMYSIFPPKGICGHPRIADVGGVPYLIPLPDLTKVSYVWPLMSLVIVEA